MDNPKATIATNANATIVVAVKRPKKKPKLDRKSSRGMIYENEELRLRTININAEVERGQSDIKRLKKENELLRREIWTLRDECDRLHKKVKAKFMAHDQAVCNLRCKKHAEPMATEYQCPCLMADGNGNGIDSDYCHTAQQAMPNSTERTDFYSVDCYCGMENDEHDHNAGGGQIAKSSYLTSIMAEHNGGSPEQQSIGNISSTTSIACKANEINGAAGTNVSLSDAFDNLSIVMEENANDQDNDTASKSSKLPSLLGRITPLTSIELVANELKDLQSLTPPLSYFEGIINQRMNPNNGNFDSGERTVSGSAETVTAGSINWDLNQQNKTVLNGSSANLLPINGTNLNSIQTSTSTSTPAHKQQDNSLLKNEGSTLKHFLGLDKSPQNETQLTSTITSPAFNKAENYRKHFFAPLKPKLKLNTNLAKQHLTRLVPAPATSPTTIEESSFIQSHGPPDLWVLNGLPTKANQPIRTTQVNEANLHDNSSPTNEELESDKLHSLLNDIETISEDIHSLQLQKNKSHEELSRTKEILECKGENLKPFKSEMNLLLTYDKSQKPKIQLNKIHGEFSAKPLFTFKHPITNSSDLRRTHSLDRNDTDSPSPNIPDAMLPFPENRNYMDFPYLNKDPFEGINGMEINSNVTQTVTSRVPPRVPFHPSGEVSTNANYANMIEISEQSNNLQRNSKNSGDGNTIIDLDNLESKKFAEDPLISLSPSANQTTMADSIYPKSNVIANNPANSLKNEHLMEANTNTKTISNLKSLSVNEQLASNKTYPNGNQIPVNENVFTTPIKCLRRHSESTVQHINHCTNAINASSPHYHHSHHHHHQHHQHQYQNHHDHSSRQGNNNEAIVTIPSEQNSSCPSTDKSRDSLSSSSPRLQRRKLSINSQHGGKIPWFGCWGNGCL